jgi:hypothetical protein
VSVGVTDAAVPGLAGPVDPEIPDEGGEVRQMREWDLCADGQMLQAICRKRPRQVMPEDVSDPGLLGAGEHAAPIVAEGRCLDHPRSSAVFRAFCRDPGTMPVRARVHGSSLPSISARLSRGTRDARPPVQVASGVSRESPHTWSEEGTEMNTTWRQILVGSVAAVVLVGLGVLEVRRDGLYTGEVN